MANFLNGLMQALHLGGGQSGGLMGSIGAATAGTPGASSAAPGSGGLMAAAGMAAPAPISAPLAPVEEVGKAPGFLERWTTVNPKTGYSKNDALGELGARIGDIGDGGDSAATYRNRAKERLNEQTKAAMAQQIDAMTDDPKLRFVLKSNPEAATKALASHYEAANVGAGDSRVFGDPADGGHTYMAPKYGVEDGQAYRFGQGGFDWGPQRDATHAEVETGRHNRAEEGLGGARVAIDRQNSGIAAGHLGVARDRLNFDRSGGAGGQGAGGLSTLSTADLIAALRGAR